jgi:uncharacterized OsmC-like protein
MGESVIVRQNRAYEIEFLALDPEAPDAHDYEHVDTIHELTPYGMLLAGLGACTAVVLNTYADYHEVGLEQVELRLTYGRAFADDCEHCQSADDYEEAIGVELTLHGELTQADRAKLLAISKRCPIHKMLTRGIEVTTQLAGAPAPGGEA